MATARTGAAHEWLVLELPWPRDLLAAAEAFALDGAACWFDAPDHPAPTTEATQRRFRRPASRWSLIAASPVALLHQRAAGPAELTIDGRAADQDASAWRLWRRTIERLPRWPASPAPLGPGWVGCLGFESADQLERLPPARTEPRSLPLVRLELFDRVVLLDHAAQRAMLVVAPGLREHVGLAPLPPDLTLDLWRTAAAAAGRMLRAAPARLIEQMSPTAHREMVHRALEHIRAGDIYQVNLAQRLRLEGLPSVWQTARRLRRGNAARYGALLTWREQGQPLALHSTSPELMCSPARSRVRARASATRPPTPCGAVNCSAQPRTRPSWP